MGSWTGSSGSHLWQAQLLNGDEFEFVDSNILLRTSIRNFGTAVRGWRTSASGDRVVKVGLWTGSPWRYTITGITWDRERVRDCGRYHIIRRDKTHIVIASEASEALWVKS